MSSPVGRLPLATLLSHAWVAFTIEFDNEFERQMPHRTTLQGATPGSPYAPWLVSMVMWTRFLRFIPDDGIQTGELKRLLGITSKEMKIWLTRLGQWWGYIVVDSDVVRPTPEGRRAREVWRPLTGVIETRWGERFGGETIAHLREALWAVVNQFDVELPDCLPILGYGLFTGGPDYAQRGSDVRERESASRYALPALLAKVLLAFAIEYERVSEVSLAIGANVLRLLREKEEVRVREFPRLAGVSKEGIAMAVSFLEKQGYARVEPESPGSRIKVVRLTAKGRAASDNYHQLVHAIEQRWQARFSKSVMERLREMLEQLVGEPTARSSPLFQGLEPYPDGWRAAIPRPDGLPHYPMVLHRGGFPDGS